MSVAEELHKTIDELSEDQQQELLETARQLLEGLHNSELSKPDLAVDTDLNQELLRRYQHLRENPDQVVSARESNSQVKARYGWS